MEKNRSYNMNYMVNPQTGKVELGQSIMGHFIPATQMNPSLYGQKPAAPQQLSMINRNPQPYQYNVPTSSQMFPLLAQNPIIQGLFANMQAPQQMQYGQGMNMGGQGLFGAGRFLNGGLLSTSTTGT